MVDPASIGDWVQASLMAGLLGSVAAACMRALREPEGQQAVAPVPAPAPAAAVGVAVGDTPR